MNPKEGRLICYVFTHCIGHDVSDRYGISHLALWHVHTHTHPRMHARTHARTHTHTHSHTHTLNRCHVSHQSCLDYWSKSEHTDSCAQPYHSLIPRPRPAFCRLQYRKRYFQSYAERAWEREAISFIHLILQFVFYSLKKIHDFRQKKKVRDSTN